MTKRLRTEANSHTSDITYVRRVVYCEGPESDEDKGNHEQWHRHASRTENGARMVMVDCCSVMSYRPSTPLLCKHIGRVSSGIHQSSISTSFDVVVMLTTASVSWRCVGILKSKKSSLSNPLWIEGTV